MLRRWVRGMLASVIVGVVVAGAVGPVAQPALLLLAGGEVRAEIGPVNVALSLEEQDG